MDSVEKVKQQQRREQEARTAVAIEKLSAAKDKHKKGKTVNTPNSTSAQQSSYEVDEPSSRKRRTVAIEQTPIALKTARFLKYENFVIDCDGVMWHGDEAIPGSIEACKRLLENQCKLHFVTNSSSNTRRAIADKLNKLGLQEVKQEWVTTSGSAAARLLQCEFSQVKKVYVVGEQGLMDELELAGLSIDGGFKDNSTDASTSAKFVNLFIDDDVHAVVCGLDRCFNYAKLSKASLYLQRSRPLICTNYDAYDVLPSKGNVPGAGCIAAALKASCPEAKATLAGKPSGDLLLQILTDREMDRTRTVVIGDRIDTDIEFAHNAGVASCLVLSGVSSEEHREKANMCQSTLETFVHSLLDI